MRYDKYDEAYEGKTYTKKGKIKHKHKTEEELQAKYGRYGKDKLNKRDKKNSCKTI